MAKSARLKHEANEMLRACEKCDGIGVGHNPRWQQFLLDYPQYKSLSSDEFAALAAKRGLENVAEEFPCCDCCGTGRVPTQFGLNVLELLAWNVEVATKGTARLKRP